MTGYFLSLATMPRQTDKAVIDRIVLRIKKLRESKGITLQEFYDDTGIHLARIESEKRDLPISTLNRICKYFDTSMSELLKGL